MRMNLALLEQKPQQEKNKRNKTIPEKLERKKKWNEKKKKTKTRKAVNCRV